MRIATQFRSGATTRGLSRPYSNTKGVIAALIAVTSPLGKPCAPLLNHWFGSSIWPGRKRRSVFQYNVARRSDNNRISRLPESLADPGSTFVP
jgi:hypothetical protein